MTFKSTVTTIGAHRVRHGTVMDSFGMEELMDGELADIIYSDPPWGDGNLKYWGTMNAKMTGEQVVQPGLDAFLAQIFRLAQRYAKNVFFVEYGIRWEQEIRRRGAAHGFTHLGLATPIYGSTNLPLHLHVFVKKPETTMDQAYFKALNGTKGFATVVQAARPFTVTNGIVLDMCCGLGYSAKLARQLGMRFRGNELNAKRLAKTMARLA